VFERLFGAPKPSYTPRETPSPLADVSRFFLGLLEQPKPTYQVDPRLTPTGPFCPAHPRYDFVPPQRDRSERTPASTHNE